MRYVYCTCPCGKIKGIGKEGFSLFRGIRYASAERWEAPEEVTAWEGIYDATIPGAFCYQYASFFKERTATAQFYFDESVEKQVIKYSEDCLNLNIWAPDGAEGAPVLLYIHGGSYETGGGFTLKCNGENYSRKGIVCVAINYQLNAFASAVGGDHTGNYGLLDQLCALQWIKHNIAAFGGDPACVTVMGESAGAMSVQSLLYTPLAKDMFVGAIMLSGGGILPTAFRTKTPEIATELWSKVREKFGVSSMEELKAVPAKDLFRVWHSVCVYDSKYAHPAIPVVDGKTIPEMPRRLVETGKVNDVPTIIGVLSEDMWPLTLYQTAVEWGELMEQNGQGPVYGLYLDRAVPGADCAYHGCDLTYAFQSFDASWRPFDETDFRIGENMAEYFVNFVKTGKPHGEGLPEWKPITRDSHLFMHFGDAPCAMYSVPEERLHGQELKNKPFPGM